MESQKKKVILMYPNTRWTSWIERTAWDLHPYNLGILASMIESDFEVKIIDGTIDNLSKEEFSEIISREKPDILGISVLTNEYGKAGDVAAELAKQAHPDLKIIIGGVHITTSNPKEILKNKFIDYLVIGEGEYIFKQLCNYLNNKAPIPEKGIAYRNEDQIIITERAEFIFDLDALPYPAYHLFDFKKYANKTQREEVGRAREFPYVRMMTSRGCPYNCCFCEVKNIAGRSVRTRSVKHIMGEIDLLVKNYRIKSIVFDDDNLLMDLPRAKELFRALISSDYDLTWNCPAMSIYNIDEETIQLMKQSGCKFLNIAIESGTQRVLRDIIHKPLDLERVKELVKLIKKYDIDLASNFIIGFPGETWEEIRQTIRYAEEVGVDYAKFFIATPSPNTELYRIAKENNYLREDFSFNQHLWTDGWINTPEFRHQDLKILRAYEWDRVNFSQPEKKAKIAQMMGISQERLDEIRKSTLKRSNP
jgi:anaerobic magnesium-protoporphyrin IX monomethyl ester cyclase